MTWRAIVLSAGLLLATMPAAFAVLPDEVLPDPALEARARQISAQLRCMVCQNQSIDESDADLARDLRLVVRDRLRAGDTDGAVIDYVVARYGEFVLLRPLWNARNALLWLAPLLMLGLAGAAILWRARKSRPAAAAPLNASEEERLRDMLERG